MKSTPEVEQLRDLLTDTITLLIKNGLKYKAEFCVEALIGITLDQEDVVLVNIKEIVKDALRANQSSQQREPPEQEDNIRSNSVRALNKRKIDKEDHGSSPIKQLRMSAENSLDGEDSFQSDPKSNSNEDHSHSEVVVKQEPSDDFSTQADSDLDTSLGQRPALSCWPDATFQGPPDSSQDANSDQATTANYMSWSGDFNEVIEESDLDISDTDDAQSLAKCNNTRHKCLTKMDLDNMSNITNEKATHRQTNWAVNTFKDWLLERNHATDFEQLPATELSILLRQFYGEVKTARKQEYSRSALCALRASLQRYLSNPPFNRSINILTDSEFVPANKVIVGRIKLNRKLGLDVTKQRSGLHPDDIDKLYRSGTLSNTTAKGLQFKVFFETALHFGITGKEGLREMTKDSFVFLEDNNGVACAMVKHNEETEQALDRTRDEQERRMYANDTEYCPIESLRKYLELLDPESPHFYQKVMSENQLNEYHRKGYWYNGKPIGANTLAEFMKTISMKAKLSQIYTNHCIRTTDFSAYVFATTLRPEKCCFDVVQLDI